jgi:hypothetical protein
LALDGKIGLNNILHLILKMATLVCTGKETRFTILPYCLDTPIQQELLTNMSDYVLGFITTNEDDKHTFTYTESGGLTEVKEHWSLAIISNLPYFERNSSWIVYSCSPEETTSAFKKILANSHETLHIYDWDTWSVEGKDAKVAIITSWEIY